MTKYRLLRPMLVIVLISGMSHKLIEASESSRRSRSYLPSFIDHGIELPNPSLSSVLGEPNESFINEEALFATHSFSDAGTKYNMEFYYRPLGSRIRIRVLVGDRELRGLLNRFYRVDTKRRLDIFFTRDEGNPKMSSTFGFMSFKGLSVDTDTVYDAMEEFVQEKFPKIRNPRIYVDPPLGLLKRTCKASLKGLYLVNDVGQVDPFTLDNLRVAYKREGIKAESSSDLERIGRSLIKAKNTDPSFNPVVISDVNEIPDYSRRPLDSTNAKKITDPKSFRKGRIDYWTCYTYKQLWGIVSQYTFGSSEGQLLSAEQLVLGRNIGRAIYLSGMSAPAQRRSLSAQDSRSPGRKDRNSIVLFLSSTVARVTFVVSGSLLLVLAYVVTRIRRSGSGVMKETISDPRTSTESRDKQEQS